jgi:hypothetical protein
MLFHVRSQAPKGFAPSATTGERGAPVATWVLSISRVLAGIGILAALLAGAFAAHSQHWEEGSSALLHLSEVVFGGVVGVIFGERVAIRDAE